MFTTVNLPHRNSGFAVVLALSIMALVTLVLLGLSTLLVVEQRGAEARVLKLSAEANARLALNMAIGQLQKEIGRDARVTSPERGNEPVTGEDHWTAAYEAWPYAADEQPERPTDREVNFRAWLVSGAEDLDNWPNRIEMLGAGTLGAAAPVAARVSAPLVSVEGQVRPGRMAWWSSDEGMKAKVNAGYDSSRADSLGLSDSLSHAQSPPHVGHHAFTDLVDFEWQPGNRQQALNESQLELMAGLGDGALGSSFHDLTVYSAGVLSDVRGNRLKQDLSNLLTRPLSEIRNKPLYLADGRMNHFEITEEGALTNASFMGISNSSGADEWGINLEELFLYHNIYSELEWEGEDDEPKQPILVTKDNLIDASENPYYMYGRPNIDVMQFILSLEAFKNSGDYIMRMKLDAMAALVNPNDVRVRYPAGLAKGLRLLTFPYDMTMKTQNPDGSPHRRRRTPAPIQTVRGYIEGNKTSAEGFDLQPGESAVFGASNLKNGELNLRRGFDPSGGVNLVDWNLHAGALTANHKVDFELEKVTSALNTGGQSNVYVHAWHIQSSHLKAPNVSNNRMFQNLSLASDKDGLPDSEIMDTLFPPTITPPQVRPVSDFYNEPQSIMIMTIARNVERSSDPAYPDALDSRPSLFDIAINPMRVERDDTPSSLHETQMVWSAAPMNYDPEWRSLAAGEGGRNLYHGGGRQPSVGGNFQVFHRRIPFAPPLSIGAFQHGIAVGITGHFVPKSEGGNHLTRLPPGADPAKAALNPNEAAFPPIAKAIGNSFATPYLSPDQVYQDSTTDPSWMANNALWDSWFLGGIVDGRADTSNPFQTDRRSAREQFSELADGSGVLRNKRFLYYPHKDQEEAEEELFDGEDLRPSALKGLAKYLMVDGAFNVNSTSVAAWTALLSSIRGQELLRPDGSTIVPLGYPLGTVGYAVDTSTSGPVGDWAGFRDLSSTEIGTLAEKIVEEVQARGPFLSMADFINRRPDSAIAEHQAVGALQAAIDKSGINDRFDSSQRTLTAADLDFLPGAEILDAEPLAARAVGSSGHLSQGDLLTAFGPLLSVRSDTFRIRAYGETLNLMGDEVLAQAWCEAIVQRLPEYVDPSDSPEAAAGWPSSGDQLASDNARFGRRLKVVSVRWLTPDEI